VPVLPATQGLIGKGGVFANSKVTRSGKRDHNSFPPKMLYLYFRTKLKNSVELILPSSPPPPPKTQNFFPKIQPPKQGDKKKIPQTPLLQKLGKKKKNP